MIIIILGLRGLNWIKNIHSVNAVIILIDDIGCHAKIAGAVSGYSP